MRRRPRGLIVAIVLVGVAGCGGDEAPDEAGGAGGPTSVVAPYTTRPRSPTNTDVDQFLRDWDAVNVAAFEAQDLPRIVLDPLAFGYGPGPGGLEAFGARLDNSVILGGLRDPASGIVTSVFVGADPDGPTTASAMVTTLFLLGGDGIAALAEVYRSIAVDPVAGNSTYTIAGNNDFVISAVAAADASDPLVHVVAAPVSDEATARPIAEGTAQAVAQVVLQSE